jgi:ATP-dependent DNA helicase RecQ
MIEKAKTILKKVFGYDDFFPMQEKVIANVLAKNDSLVVMPTGGGKSLCYQIPGLIFDGLTVVVSPLISLMKDQVDQLKALDVPAVMLNSQLPADVYRQNVGQIKRNKAKLLYLAPETFLKKNILDLLSTVQVDGLAVDEAHCISRWGHDFRPEYRRLAETRAIFKDAVCIALTATATVRVRKDIQNSLGFSASNEFVASFNRPNLFIQVAEKLHPLQQTLAFIEKNAGESGIIYCATRNTVDRLCEKLTKQGIAAKPYHAGLPDHERNTNQDLFINDDIQVIAATIAFGMGIDKPDVRFVLHYDLPQNIENYYQEIGRAGRDGLPATCLLLFGYGDIPKIRYIIQNKSGHEQRLANIHLSSLLQFVECEACRRVPLLDYLGEDHPGNCKNCDNCLAGERPEIDVTVSAQKFLSCVKRTGERFGANYIIDVLRGSKAKKILQFGHDKLSTYGIGKEYSQKQWHHLSRMFLSKGLMVQDMEYGGLGLTDEAYAVFKGQKVFVKHVVSDMPPRTPAAPVENLEYDRGLFEVLRKERKALADQANLPPYVIFSDRTLIQMATFFPKTDVEMLQIHGVGAVKLDRYGDTFLKIISTYVNKKND